MDPTQTALVETWLESHTHESASFEEQFVAITFGDRRDTQISDFPAVPLRISLKAKDTTVRFSGSLPSTVCFLLRVNQNLTLDGLVGRPIEIVGAEPKGGGFAYLRSTLSAPALTISGNVSFEEAVSPMDRLELRECWLRVGIPSSANT